jgi:hypothetical protein
MILVIVPDAPHLGHHDTVGVVRHMQHLMGVMTHRAMLLLALLA